MTLAIPSKDTVVALCQLHSSSSDLVFPPIFDYQSKHTFVLDRTLFAQAFITTPHLFLGGLSRMVYEHLLKCFILEDPSLGFLKLFQATTVVVHGDILRSVALVLRASRLLAMAKNTRGLHPIAVGDVFCQLSHSIVFQLWGLFQEYLSPH